MRYRAGSRKWMFGDAMSMRDRRVRVPSGNSPFRMRSNKSRFSSTERSRQGLGLPGRSGTPRYSDICSGFRSQT